MPSVDWREVADNWFGTCCCSFGGVSEKLVARYANCYKCDEGICHLSSTTVTLCKDDLVEWKFPDWVRGKCNESGLDFTDDNGFGDVSLDSGSKCKGVITCDDSSEETHTSDGKSRFTHPKNDNVAAKLRCGVNEEETNDDPSFCLLQESGILKDVASTPGCCAHVETHVLNHVDKDSIHHVSETEEIKANQKFLLNGFLGSDFMVRSFNQSVEVEWIEYVCAQCSSLLGVYPYCNGNAPVDLGVRLFKCYISNCLPVGGSADLFRYTNNALQFTCLYL